MLNTGDQVGPYEIAGSLGAGGMGEVYRARDRRLNRDVAIKILPAVFASDFDRVARFTREAQTLAALNHPHIAQIYGIEESDSQRALVMELVEGETLADRLARGAIALDDALPIARQIAEALEAAHEAGIIHRDLKPANIKVRPDGSVKVLDFGLAKATDSAGGPRKEVLNSPTITSPAMTAAGVILGTAAYMSPEQAKGKAADRRSDIWAFGCVLFEMLTARPLFAADSVTETLARVIEREPDLSALPAATPPAVRTLIRRSLQRNSKQRLRDIGEARITLEDPLVAAPPGETHAPAASRRTLAFLMLATAGIAAIATAWVIRATDAPISPAQRRFALATPQDAPPLLASIAPDASAILVIAADKLWLQQLDSFAATEVPGSEGAHAPFWSPDSASFGFHARGQLWRVARDGGTPIGIGRVSEFTQFTFAGGAAWLPDGRVVYTTGGTGLLQIQATGGQPKPLFELDPAKEADIHNVSALPDGKSLLYVVHPTAGRWTIELFDLRDSSRHTLYTAVERPGVHHPVYSSSGHVLFEYASGIWAMPMSVPDRKATGEPFLVVSNARQPTIAADGTLVMIPGGGPGADAGLAWIDRTGKTLRTVAEPRGSLFNPRVSPDGRLAAAARGSSSAADLWLFDLERGTERRLTFEGGANVKPLWSSDGQYIVYQCERTICARRADGAGPRVEVLDAPASDPALSPDGKLLAFVREVKPGDTDIFVVDLGAGGVATKATAEPRVIVSAPRVQAGPEISPDGRYVAYSSAEGGPFSVYVSQFPSGQGKWQLPLGFANWPRWSPKGDRMYVTDELARIIELPVDRTRLFEVGAPIARTPGNPLLTGGFDRSVDGTQFLIPIAPTGALTPGRLLVAQNWRPETR